MYTRKLHGYFRTEDPLFLPALVSVDPELGVYFLNWRAMLLNCEGFSLSVRCSLYFSRKCGEMNNLLPSKRQYQEKATESSPQSIFMRVGQCFETDTWVGVGEAYYMNYLIHSESFAPS